MYHVANTLRTRAALHSKLMQIMQDIAGYNIHQYLTAVGVFRRPPRPELFGFLKPLKQRHDIGEIKCKCMQ